MKLRFVTPRSSGGAPFGSRVGARTGQAGYQQSHKTLKR